MAQTLFRHEGRTQFAALGDRQPAGWLAVNEKRFVAGEKFLARDRVEQFGLAIAGDARNGDDFTARDAEGDIAQGDTEGTILRQAQSVEYKARLAGYVFRLAHDMNI